MRIIIRKGTPGSRSLFRRPGWALLGATLVVLVGGATVFTAYYVRFSRMIDERLQGQVFPETSQVYAAPVSLRVGQPASATAVAAQLRLAGFAENSDSPRGRYQLVRGGIRIYPGPDSFFSPEPAELDFADGNLSSIVSLKDQFARNEISLEPLLITNLFDRSREKRRLVTFQDLPPYLVKAVLAIEDRRFFDHSGIDFVGVARSAYIDLRSGRIRQGASTLTMQVARMLFLTPERTWKRKLAEALVAIQLEHRLSKEQIFEYYCNTIYLGQRGSFSIRGFGEAAQAFFRKDVRNLTLPEVALLTGLAQGPSLYSPYRHPDAAKARRNQVLDAMLGTHAISQPEHDEAVQAALDLAPDYLVASEAPYFVDMLKDQLLDRFSEEELTSQSYRIYTTLDLRLQRAAAEAISVGVQELDKRLADLRKGRPRRNDADSNGPRPEVALVALDPHTGAVKALIGGRDYGASQLNRALAERQPGSVFKPFVYAAALTAYQSGASDHPWTPISKVMDEPTTFLFDGKPYQPANYGQDYFGEVTLRYALTHSLNVATVKVAESIGYDTIVSLARRAGMNPKIQPTPAVALGAYEVTPLEVAGAYTIFANRGVRIDPYFLAMVRSKSGTLLDVTYPRKIPVLDPAVAFLMTNLLEDVINHGTGAGVRARGFTAPAAGKTGTSHDGWFAGYTDDLICVVWVGYDSDLELPLSGASSALPIWTEFMKRAITVPEYSDASVPEPPPNVVQVEIDPEAGSWQHPIVPPHKRSFSLRAPSQASIATCITCQPFLRLSPLRRLHVPAILRRASRPDPRSCKSSSLLRLLP